MLAPTTDVMPVSGGWDATSQSGIIITKIECAIDITRCKAYRVAKFVAAAVAAVHRTMKQL